MDPIESYIRQAATQRGIDPDVAVQVAKSEGINYTGDQGSSFGPFQLHYGGVASGGNAVSGLGDQFTAQTGLHANDPSTIPAQIDFALDNAAKNGWGAWHAWHGDPYAGIPQGGKMATNAPPAAPMSDAEAAQFLQSRETAKSTPSATMSDQEAAKFLEQREAATANPPAAPAPPAPPGSVPTPPQVGTEGGILNIDIGSGRTWETPVEAQAEAARGAANTGPSIAEPINAAENAIVSSAAGGAQRFNQALPDWIAGNTASAAGDVGMGLSQIATSPLSGLSEGVAQFTGNPEIGQRAADVAGFILPVPKVMSAVNEARPSVQGLNELIKNIPPEDVAPGLARLEANPRLSPADVFPSIRQQVQGLGVTQGPWQGFLDQVSKQRGQDAFNSVTNATNTLQVPGMEGGVSDSAYNTLQGIMQRARDTGQQVIQPALDNSEPVPLKPLVQALDRQIKSPEAIAGETPRIPLTPTQQQLLSLRNDITSGEMAPLNERTKLAVGPINDAIKNGALGTQRLQDFTEARRLLNSANRGFTSEEDLIPALKKLANNQKIVGPIDDALKMIQKGPTEYRSADFLHGVQSRLRETADTLNNSSTGSDRLMSKDIYTARNTVINAIDKASGGTYKPALSKYRDDMQVREAFDKGLGVAKTRQGEAGILEDSPQAWQAWSKTASPDEMDAARAGALADLQRRVAQASKPVSEQTAGAPIPQINQNERARFDTLFGPDKTNMFIQKLRDEKDRGSLNQILFGGSQTAARQAGQESVAAPPARGTSAGTNPNLTALLSGAAAEGFGHMVGAPTGSLMLPVAAATRVIPPIYNRAMTAVDMARWRARNNVMAQHALSEGEDRDTLMGLLRGRQAASTGTGNKLKDLLASPHLSALPH